MEFVSEHILGHGSKPCQMNLGIDGSKNPKLRNVSSMEFILTPRSLDIEERLQILHPNITVIFLSFANMPSFCWMFASFVPLII